MNVTTFDIRTSLPSGITVLEASAGTGKTYTIAALTARYVAEGTPIDRILIVTFTRIAAGELRNRVRERLVDVERALTRALSGGPQPLDEVSRLLAEGSDAEVRARRDCLTRALADFDTATIATTHGFCQEVLGGLGIAGDMAADAEFVEDLSDLRDEIVDDLFLLRFYEHEGPDLSRAQAIVIARMALDNPGANIEPAAAHGDGIVPTRVRLAHRVRKEFRARKLANGVMSYDDLLVRLNTALAGLGGDAIVSRLQRRFEIVLVDEFQDTDPIQWEIMRRVFGRDGGRLVVIGDPKQAIYGFRGADVYAYLDAAEAANCHLKLTVNWRSDQALLDAYDALFAGARLGHEGIVYSGVSAVANNQRPRLLGAADSSPLRIRIAPRNDPSVGTTASSGHAPARQAREHVANDLARDLVALLESGAEIEVRDRNGAPVRRERVRPGDVAVLVPFHRNATLVREALDLAGIPAVVSGAGSVFDTPAAREWLRLLEAIERPASASHARSAALTSFIGWAPDRVAAAVDQEWDALHLRLHEWARALRMRDVASLFERVTLTEELPSPSARARRR